MKVPESLANAFGKEFQNQIGEFAFQNEMLPSLEDLTSNRFLNRSVVPHIVKLSQLFNRYQKDQADALAPYWKESSNPAHLRLAYFLYFMPSNLFRVASIWAELSRLGFKWHSENFQAVEFGAGPASGAAGIGAGEKYAPVGLPSSATWALIEQDRNILELGNEWVKTYFPSLGFPDWGTRTFHRKIDLKQGFLPKAAPKFDLWLMSYYLNELDLPAKELAPLLLKSWKNHLNPEGIVILVEPALKLQSRKLLELRKELLQTESEMQVLTPCLGHQNCGALAAEDDWCHEEVTWWRPPYFKMIDQMAGLDRRTLPFSYLVLIKSQRPRHEILPQIGNRPNTYRLVSPAHSEGKDLEFFLCGQEGKRRARYRPQNEEDVQRGSILLETELRGNENSGRIDRVVKVL